MGKRNMLGFEMECTLPVALPISADPTGRPDHRLAALPPKERGDRRAGRRWQMRSHRRQNQRPTAPTLRRSGHPNAIVLPPNPNSGQDQPGFMRPNFERSVRE